ncbi:MAG: NAD-dependent epimerase/dehydratase family protein, partial [Planctomycetota bacterium]
MNVLVTGGAGYIGSHAALRLMADGHAVTVIDDLSRGNLGAIDVLHAAGEVHFVEA